MRPVTDVTGDTTAPSTSERWMEEEFLCPCYYTDNFFVRSLGRHVTYDGTAAGFDAAHPNIVKDMTDERRRDVHMELEGELARRRGHFAAARKRRAFVAANYKPLRPEVYTLRDDFVDPRWVELAELARTHGGKDALMKASGIVRQRPRGVFAFPALTPRFCELMREELDHFERSDMPRAHPNTMNKNGLLLYELGMYENLLNPLLERYVSPVAAALFDGGAREMADGSDSLDHHRSFTVRYEPEGAGKDTDLAYHFDDAELTLNVNLGGHFEGGELCFGALSSDGDEMHSARYPHFHREGIAILHRGSHCHEAFPVEEGKRVNLIMWCRSSDVRKHGRCAMCGKPRAEKEEEGEDDDH